MDVLDVLDGSSDDEGDSHVGDPATGRSGPERDGSGGGGGGDATSLSEQGEPRGAGAAEATCIKVALRIRPALPRELFHPAGFRTVADPGTEGTTIRVLPPANAPRHRQADVTSSFDRVFGIEVRTGADTGVGVGAQRVQQRPAAARTARHARCLAVLAAESKPGPPP